MNQNQISVFFSGLICCCVTLFSSCDNNEYSKEWNAYTYSLNINDKETATSILHIMLAKYPDKLELYDSLSVMYYNREMYQQAFSVATTALSVPSNGDNVTLLKIAAETARIAGLQDEALKYHLRLLEFKADDIVLLYDIGILYYSVAQIKVGIQYMDRVINHPEAKSKTIVLIAGEQKQNIPYYAAALNVKGFGLSETGNKEEAESCYKKALELSPDFINAQKNLQFLLAK